VSAIRQTAPVRAPYVADSAAPTGSTVTTRRLESAVPRIVSLLLVVVLSAASLAAPTRAAAQPPAAVVASSPILSVVAGEYVLLFPTTGRTVRLGFSGFSATFSPDAASIAYGEYDADRDITSVRVRTESGADRLVTRVPGPFLDLSWAPDSKRLVLVTTTGSDTLTDVIRVATVATGATTPVYSWTHPRYDGSLEPAWRPGTERIFFVKGAVNLYSVASSGGTATQHTHICDPDEGDCEYYTEGYRTPRWNADGSRLALSYDDQTSDDGHLTYALWTPEHPDTRTTVAEIPSTTDGTTYYSQPVWSPDDMALALYFRPGDTAGETQVRPLDGSPSLYTTTRPIIDWQPCTSACPDFTDVPAPPKKATSTAVKLIRRAGLSATVSVNPKTARGTAKVTLQTLVNGRWKSKGTKSGPLSGKGTFVAKFARPKQARCRFRSLYVGSATYKPSSKTLNFRC
jgi:hypothetical protein